MALQLLTEAQEKRIVNNVVKACKDINKLNKQGYNFIYPSPGFIAHYSLYGFKEEYSYRSLKSDILMNQRQNQYNNFHPGENDYEYYKQKAKIYNAIVDKIK